MQKLDYGLWDKHNQLFGQIKKTILLSFTIFGSASI